MYNHFVMRSERVNYGSAYLSVKPITKLLIALSEIECYDQVNRIHHVQDVHTAPGVPWL